MKAIDGIVACSPWLLKAAGYSAIGRYCPMIDNGQELGQYPLTAGELQTYTAADVGTFLFVELDPSAPSDLGGEGGRQYATWALAGCAALKVPQGAGLYFSNDAVVTNEANVLAFYRVAAVIVASGGYRMGLYGQSSVWQSVKGGVELFCHAPDGTNPPWPDGTNIAQHPPPQVTVGGNSYDADDILTPSDFGAFTGSGLWPPPSTKGEIDMLLVKAAGTNGPWYVVGEMGKRELGPSELAGYNALLAPLGLVRANFDADQLAGINTAPTFSAGPVDSSGDNPPPPVDDGEDPDPGEGAVVESG